MIKLFVHILAGITTLLGINQLLYSQTFYSTELYGIVKSVNGESITKAHIINLYNKTGTISNDEGMFQILANKTDIIQISSIGYKTLLYVIPNTDQVKLVKYFTISIDTINLAETTIYPFPQTLEELEREFLELSIEDDTPTVELHLEKAGISALPQTGAIIQGPFTALYEKFSRSAKFRRKYEALMDYEYKKQQAAKIYNTELVIKLTGLKTEEEISRFMEYCELDPDFILGSRTYDLYLALQNCYSEFKNINH